MGMGSIRSKLATAGTKVRRGTRGFWTGLEKAGVANYVIVWLPLVILVALTLDNPTGWPGQTLAGATAVTYLIMVFPRATTPGGKRVRPELPVAYHLVGWTGLIACLATIAVGVLSKSHMLG